MWKRISHQQWNCWGMCFHNNYIKNKSCFDPPCGATQIPWKSMKSARVKQFQQLKKLEEKKMKMKKKWDQCRLWLKEIKYRHPCLNPANPVFASDLLTSEKCLLNTRKLKSVSYSSEQIQQHIAAVLFSDGSSLKNYQCKSCSPSTLHAYIVVYIMFPGFTIR